MIPTIGRIVHYYGHSPLGGGQGEDLKLFPAIITEVEHKPSTGSTTGDVEHTFDITLAVIYPHGLLNEVKHIGYSDVYKPSHWSWPPKV